MKKPILAALFALAMGAMVAGCASGGAAPGSGASTGSGVTVFGTVDAGVSGYSTKSEKR